MNCYWQKVKGVVIQGHQVASRKSEHYPHGTIEMQIPHFKERGLDLTSLFRGTVNLSISPKSMTPIAPEYTFRDVQWTTAHPAEDFSFSKCQITHRNRKYQGWIYYPHPETKERHFQDPSIIEVIAPLIEEIRYGDEIELEINTNEISINDLNP